MSTPTSPLHEPLLDSWDRCHRILVGLLGVLPEGALGVHASEGGHSVAELFMHAHSVRLAFVEENVPELGVKAPTEEWIDERNPERIAALLGESHRAVRDALLARLGSGRPMDRHFDHPLLMLQLLIWHEGYHHGQIKLALKLAGMPIDDRVAGPVSWAVWIRKSNPA